MIGVKLKKIINLQGVIKTNELHSESKSSKFHSLNEYSFPIVFSKDIHEGHLSLKDADDEQSNFAATLKKTNEKELFLNNF